MSWFKEVSEYPVEELVCLYPGKNPTPEKIAEYCRTCEHGQGCPNLVHKSYLDFKPGEVFGRHSWKIEKASHK